MLFRSFHNIPLFAYRRNGNDAEKRAKLLFFKNGHSVFCSPDSQFVQRVKPIILRGVLFHILPSIDVVILYIRRNLLSVYIGRRSFGKQTPSRFTALQEELTARIRAIEVQVEDMAGTAVNLNSPKQVADLLFVQLGFAPEGKTKGKTGFSTSAAVLEHLARLPGGEVPALLLEHRELSKMQSGFMVPLQKAAEEGEGVIATRPS